MQKFVLSVLFAFVASLSLSSANTPKSYKCVDLKDEVPCKDRIDGSYDICRACDLGFYVECADEEIKAVHSCHQVQVEGAWSKRFTFDSARNQCVLESTTCTEDKYRQ
ncbi:hypothetical protein ElyMa_000523700 [Elysia marginata]|uniref:Chitin-binding type-2 domain-containing protein n=1 Tax=Elysia marginata TaxID=1093978 RepID=A0AAV4FZ77_9GAST|nr:hypothetical protein ElyMa_000523700 [Elysia marginata]